MVRSCLVKCLVPTKRGMAITLDVSCSVKSFFDLQLWTVKPSCRIKCLEVNIYANHGYIHLSIIGCVQYWHVTFTVHTFELTFKSWGGGQGGGVQPRKMSSCDHSARLPFNTCRPNTLDIFKETMEFQLYLCRQSHIFI